MAGLRNTIAALAQGRKLFSPLDTNPTGANIIDRQEPSVQDVTGFGDNPGNLRMFKYVPSELPPGRPLVVVLHGCTQHAVDYARDTGWLSLAESERFVVVAPEQQRVNNPNNCWNWFSNPDIQRDRGEVFSIWEMVEKTIVDHGIDRTRVYVTGLSAGGAMASALLATYPDVFAGGAIVAGLPYRCAGNVQQALAAMANPPTVAPRMLGDLVRGASLHRGPWPTVSIWHGTADPVVAPTNADALARQWCDVHGVSETAFRDDVLSGGQRRTWRGPDGSVVVEKIVIDGLQHGTPIDAGGVSGPALGRPAPFILDVGIGSTHHMARIWKLASGQPQARRANASVQAEPEPARPGANVLETAARDALTVIRRLLPRKRQGPSTGRGREAKEAGQWEKQAAAGDAAVYFGYASSGIGCDGGLKTKTMSRRVKLGATPRLLFERRLHLHAGINVFTKAAFQVWVDRCLVEQETVTFANRLDHEWSARDIDLKRFAGRDVEIRFEVAAECNVCMEVFAKAWIKDLQIKDAAAAVA